MSLGVVRRIKLPFSAVCDVHETFILLKSFVSRVLFGKNMEMLTLDLSSVGKEGQHRSRKTS